MKQYIISKNYLYNHIIYHSLSFFFSFLIFLSGDVDNKSNVKKKKTLLFVDQEEFYSQVLVPVEETGVCFFFIKPVLYQTQTIYCYIL
jgi:hypothetical protein